MVQQLPEEKIKNGYKYTLIQRNKLAAIYKQENIKEPSDKSIGYEVFKIIITKPFSLVQKSGKNKGQIYSYPEMEKFPGDEQFGRDAWAFMTKDAAMKKFNEISTDLTK